MPALSGLVSSGATKSNSIRETLIAPDKSFEREHSPEILDPSDPESEGFPPSYRSPRTPLGSGGLVSSLRRDSPDVGLRSSLQEISHVRRSRNLHTVPSRSTSVDRRLSGVYADERHLHTVPSRSTPVDRRLSGVYADVRHDRRSRRFFQKPSVYRSRSKISF